MDNKITKKRLSQLLSYDLWKILAIIIAAIFVWSLLFTTLGPRLSEGQMLNIYSYNVTVTSAEMNDLIDTEKDNGAYYSYEVYQTKFYDFGKYNSSDTTVTQQFTAWSSVGQLDAIFISDGDDITTTDEEGNEIHLSLFDRYAYYFIDLNQLASSALSYCKLSGGFSENGTYNAETIRNYFTLRKQSDNFYRHGLINAEQEIARFEKIWQNAAVLKSMLEDDSLSSVWRIYKDEEGKEYNLGIKLGELQKIKGANVQTGKSFSTLCSLGNKDEEGNATAEGIVLSIFNNAVHQEDLMYESLAFLVKTLKTYTSI